MENCSRCEKETQSLWYIDGGRENGLCDDCHYADLLKKYPAPPLEDLKINQGLMEGYQEWPHPYIPRACPYCNGEIKDVMTGSYLDHVCSIHFCEKCKVYFGDTD